MDEITKEIKISSLLIDNFKQHNKYKKNILTISFVTVFDYLAKCFMIVKFFAESPAKRNFMLYLPAAVSDFYIP